MNYCTKCESYYQKAGTCNCFAGTGVKLNPPTITTTPPITNPYYPYPNQYPNTGVTYVPTYNSITSDNFLYNAHQKVS